MNPVGRLAVAALLVAALFIGHACARRAGPDDAARAYVKADLERDYSGQYDLLAPSDRMGDTKEQWIQDQRDADERAKARGGGVQPHRVKVVQLQLDRDLGGRRDYTAVVTFADSRTGTEYVAVVPTDQGWKALRDPNS